MCTKALRRPAAALHSAGGNVTDPTGLKRKAVGVDTSAKRRQPTERNMIEPQRSMATTQPVAPPTAAGKTALGA